MPQFALEPEQDSANHVGHKKISPVHLTHFAPHEKLHSGTKWHDCHPTGLLLISVKRKGFTRRRKTQSGEVHGQIA
jgi:hypothetical protein